jgi:hypothetical protein
MANQPLDWETKLLSFESVLSREAFTGLKAILDALAHDREALCEGVKGANSFEELLARPDIPTKNSMPTLVNLDSTVTATPQSAGFFNKMLAAFKTQLSA